MKYKKILLLSGLGVICFLWALSFIMSRVYIYPLHHAARVGNVEKVTAELDKGADANELSHSGITPIHSALAGPNSTEKIILEKMIRAGADVNKSSSRGWTPLHFAAYLRDTMALRLLLRHSADTFFNNPDGKTPRMLAEEITNVWRSIDPKQEALNQATINAFKNNVCNNKMPVAEHHHNHKLATIYLNKKSWLPAYYLVRTKLITGGVFSNLMWMLLFIGLWVIVREFVKNENSKVVKILFSNFSALIFIYIVWSGIILSFFIETAHIPSLSMYPGLYVGDHIIVSRWHRLQKLSRKDVIIFNPLPEEELNTDVYVVKRIIGLPGDVIEISPAQLFINDTIQTPDMRGNVPLHAWLREKLGLANKETIKIGRDGTISVSGTQIPMQRLADTLHVSVNKLRLFPGLLAINGIVEDEPYISEDMDFAFHAYEIPQGAFFLMGDNRNRSIDSRIWGPIQMDQVVGEVQYRYLPFSRFGKISLL